jgi:hypothetical protein
MTAVNRHDAPLKEGVRGETMGSPTLTLWVEEGV